MGMVMRSGLLMALVLVPVASSAQNLTGLDYRSLTVPGDEPGFALPSREQMTRPPGYDRFLDMADEIARQSSGQQERTMRDVAEALHLAPTGDMTGQDTGPEAAPAIVARRLPEGFRATIMLTAAMGERELKALFATLGGRPDLRFAFRGVPAAMNVPDFAVWLQSLFDDPAMLEATNIVLDPELFAQTDTRLAPTILLEDMTGRTAAMADSDTGRIVASATGFSNPDWLHDSYRRGQTSFPSADAVLVEEEDLRQRAEREAAAKLASLTTDPDVLMARYWQRLGRDMDGSRVTPAAQARERWLHSTFIPEEPIRDHTGRVLAWPGEIFDPSTVLPFDRQILVFDPTREGELDFVAARLADAPSGISRQVLIVARLPAVSPGAAPWQGLQDLVTRFGLPVYVLTADFRQRFGIEHTPTEIRPLREGARTRVLVSETVTGEVGQ